MVLTFRYISDRTRRCRNAKSGLTRLPFHSQVTLRITAMAGKSHAVCVCGLSRDRRYPRMDGHRRVKTLSGCAAAVESTRIALADVAV